MSKDKKYLPGAGVDVGTANIVVSRQDEDGNFVNTTHRNMLYELEESEESADLLERGNYLYAKFEGKYYVIGKDALALVNALGSGEVARPMKDGLLNPQLKSSQELLFHIIKAVLGKPVVENEPLRYSVPADPIDRPDMNNIFHEMIIKNFLENVGFDAHPLNEGMGVVYDLAPIMNVDGAEVPLTGFGISMGGGMFNVAGAYKGLPVCTFSITKSGDYIDQQAATVCGLPVSKVTKIKETKLDLNNVDISDRTIAALSIYYDETIKRAVLNIKSELSKTEHDFEGPCEIVIAGGTALIPGTADRFKEIAKKEGMPFDLLNVRLSEHPFYSVAQGMCLRARSDWEKKKK